jgi:hypothetical protein
MVGQSKTGATGVGDALLGLGSKVTSTMSSLTCPQCHASFHVGFIYEPLDACPRCGEPFDDSRRQARGIFSRRRASSEPDWEAITSSQYVRRTVKPSPPDGEEDRAT